MLNESNAASGSLAAVRPHSLGVTGDSQVEQVRLSEVCDEAIAEVSRALPGHLIELEPWGDADGAWDRDGLRQLVVKLISNAIANGTPGKAVIISVVDRSQDAVVIVANHGPPLPERVREYLLDPDRLDPWPNDGLGLSSIKRTVDRLGGRIDLGEGDHGVVVRIWLPKHRRQ